MSVERPRPWFGTWPPKLNGGEDNMKSRTWWERWQLTALMIFILLVGVIILLACRVFLENYPDVEYVVVHIAVAFIIAAILGLTIDQFFRRQLAEDAFRASVGYLLPDELKGEMEWIYSTHILCVEHNQTCELRLVNEETCSIYTKTIRKFRNISGNKEIAPLSVAIDEWFHKAGKSKILNFGYTKLGTKFEKFETTKNAYSLIVKKQEVTLAPGEEFTMWCETEEIKHRNDVTDWAFSCPTLNPIINVKSIEGIGINVSFGYRSQAEELGTNTYRLKGTLLPGQRIEIRWWRVADANKWLSEDKNSE
ncbi:hypothetical protein ACFLXD_00445 [Chloroflexota bacterium]